MNNIEVRWKEYFVQLLNGDEISKVGENSRRGRIGGNERGGERGDNECAKDER